MRKVTAGKADYLKVIYLYGGESENVSNKVIASALQVSPASVSEMLDRLCKSNLIEYIPYKGALLTEEGKKATLTVIRNHRILERFLYDALQFTLYEVDAIADGLEHIDNQDFYDRLYEFLGKPSSCPHGSIISDTGDMEEVYTHSFFDFSEQAIVELCRIRDVPEFLQFLEQINLSIKDVLKIVKKDECNKIIFFENITKKTKDYINYEQAKKLYVKLVLK